MNKLLTFAVLLLISGNAFAQQGTTSPYSFYGMGATNFKGTAESRAMGGLRIANDSIHLNMLNASSLPDLELVNYTVGASYQRANQKVGNEKLTATTATFDYLAMGIPLGKFGVSFGLVPSSSIGYSLISETESGRSTEYEGEGGVNKTFLSLGYALTKRWNIGVSAGYNFGSLKNIGISRIKGVEYATREQNEFDVSGFDFQLSTTYTLPLENRKYFVGSLTYTPKYSLDTENSRLIETIMYSSTGEHVVVDSRDLGMIDSSLDMPSEYTVGLGYGREKHWFVGGEYSQRDAEEFNSHSLALNNVEFTSSKTYRLGGYWIPNYRALSGIHKRLVYRMGMRYEEMGLQINGQKINEIGMSFGLGIPMTRAFSNINIAAEFGKRGTTKSGLIQENFLNFVLTLSLNDKWFQKRYIY